MQDLDWHLRFNLLPQEKRDGAWQTHLENRAFRLNVCEGSILELTSLFSNMFPGKKTFYNKDRNIIVEAPYKGACRSIENFLLNDCPDTGWKRLPQYHFDPEHPDFIQNFYDILNKDPEIHTLVRDPIARLASGFRHITDDIIKFSGIWFNMSDSFKYFEPRVTIDTHLVPQWASNKFVGDISILMSKLKENFYKNYELILEDTNLLEKMYRNTNHHWTVMMAFCCGGWFYNQDLFQPSDFKRSSKYYWVWDAVEESDDEFIEKNHMIHLCHNLGYHDLKLLNHPALRKKIGHNISNSNTLDFIYGQKEMFIEAKDYCRGDYRWIDTLTFENTPDGKPVYII